ncbi:MAG: virulence factor [Paenibacillaceae bacterium]|jgi:hypothetical protein|nr:virulence factor [Paenibacillaceae bacterium]
MKIVKIEPTPSPNSMKLTLDTRLNPGVRLEVQRGRDDLAPAYIRKLLSIEGVKEVFQTADFLALERHPRGDWAAILAEAEAVLGTAAGQTAPSSGAPGSGIQQESGYGELTVRVQTFRGIPMQVRVSSANSEKRAALPERFQRAATEAGLASPNLIMERKLEERGVRYGELEEVLSQVVSELEAEFNAGRLEALVSQSVQAGHTYQAPETGGSPKSEGLPTAVVQELERLLNDSDWQVRYATLSRIKADTGTLPLLKIALHDRNISVRRLAVVLAGGVEGEEPLSLLISAMKDTSPVIRRTAGDSISDRGDPAAVPAMEGALSDPSKLVRWRAARFLYEAAGESSLEALEKAKEDSEFEIRLQVRLAIERITSNTEAQGTVWQQMMRERL